MFGHCLLAGGSCAGRRKRQNPRKRGFACGASAPLPAIFEPEWHEWIVKRQGQLAAFRRYIRENAARAWLRRQELYARCHEMIDLAVAGLALRPPHSQIPDAACRSR